ncbi:MAG: addiction module protein [Candidatus Tectomicrobia bacterium]|uniref:Addiction module protein n=1 Tax=Tectimicrobiota bacterium TaxID=2528274 RepID=A0A932HVY6_UNCTE|nr:addiction module protein [Candidatus Tectomicrobia bacterium]
MTTVIAEIEAKFRSLSDGEKAEVLRSLLAELDGPAEAGAERAWLEEARKRHRELAEGKVQPVAADRVFENLRSRLDG